MKWFILSLQSYEHEMFYPLIAETEIVNKDLEDQYKHRATLQSQRQRW